MRFESEHIYHIYNRGNNRQTIFFEEKNYLFFLKKIRKHLLPLVDVLAYCLMPNHFHLMICVPREDQPDGSCGIPQDPSGWSDSLPMPNNVPGQSRRISNAIAVILRSYTQAINKRYDRTGSLFQQKTKARDLDEGDPDYALTCFHYIHQNPLRAGLVNQIVDWKYSSFIDYTNLRNGTLCNRKLAGSLLDLPQKSADFYKYSESFVVDNFKV